MNSRSPLHATSCAAVLVAIAGCVAKPLPPAAAPPAPPSAPTEVAAPPASSARESPPAPGPARSYRSPKVEWEGLPNGLRVAFIASSALPIVQIRLVVAGGTASDGDKPGLASMTAELLKDGGAGAMSSRELVTKMESLGATLTVSTSADATTFGVAVTKDRVGPAVDLLSAIVVKPQFSPVEFDKLKKREADELADTARTNGAWDASMMVFRELFALPNAHHPYATWNPTANDVRRLSVADCRAYHHRYYVPRNMFIAIAGDTTKTDALALTAHAFGPLHGGDTPEVAFTDPVPPAGRRIILVDRPKASQSDVFVAFLGPERGDKGFPAFQVMNQILGGGVSGRLFTEVREKQALAYQARSFVTDLAHGPSVLRAYTGTQTAKTGLALKSLLDNLDRLAAAAPEAGEVQMATRYLADVFAINLETTGAVADELAHLRVLGLPDDYDDVYRRELTGITPTLAAKAAGERILKDHEVIVVAGDAKTVGPMLSHFGEVRVVDPAKDFAPVRTLSLDPSAPIEAPRESGE